MKREAKSPLILALQRAQIALHEVALEVGRIVDERKAHEVVVRELRETIKRLEQEKSALS